MFDAMEVDYKPAHWESACRQILLDGLSSGDLVAAVAESDGYIGSVATDTDWRRQGVGRQVIESLIEMLQGRGVAEIDLHATEDSESLYRAIGFVDRGGADLRLGGSADFPFSSDV